MITGSSGCEIIPPLCFADRQAVRASKLAPTKAVLISKCCACAKESILKTLSPSHSQHSDICAQIPLWAHLALQTKTLPARPYTCRRTVRAATAPGKTLHLAGAPSGRPRGAYTGPFPPLIPAICGTRRDYSKVQLLSPRTTLLVVLHAPLLSLSLTHADRAPRPGE
jgi:hypothetical protein